MPCYQPYVAPDTWGSLRAVLLLCRRYHAYILSLHPLEPRVRSDDVSQATVQLLEMRALLSHGQMVGLGSLIGQL